MKFSPTPIAGLLIFEPRIFPDSRGLFTERFKASVFKEQGVGGFVQDNFSRSKPAVLRGLHFQTEPPQGKFVSCLRGRIWDVAVDLRKGSPTFGKYFGVELSGENLKSLWIPAGFAHGFCVLGDEEADVYYKCTGEFNAATDGGVRWNDPAFGIEWPLKDPIVSEKDQKLPFVQELQPL